MQLKKNIVFIIHTLYQAYLSMKIIKDAGLRNDHRYIIIDSISDFRLTELQFPKPELELIKFSISEKFINQLFYSHSDVKSIIQKIGAVDRLYIYNDVEPVVALFAKIVKKSRGDVYFVEEGLSAYRTIPWDSFEYSKGILKKIACNAFGFKYSIKFGHSPYISKLMLTNPSIFEVNHPYNKTAKEIISNDLTSYFSDIKDNDVIFFSDLVSAIEYPAIFYLGQPLSEFGMIEERSEIEIIDNIRNICLSNKFNFYVKRHPSERFIKYRNTECISTFLPAEIVINLLNKKKVIICSPFSSVNFNFIGHQLLGNIHLYKVFGIYPAIPNLPVTAIENLSLLNEMMRKL